MYIDVFYTVYSVGTKKQKTDCLLDFSDLTAANTKFSQTIGSFLYLILHHQF